MPRAIAVLISLVVFLVALACGEQEQSRIAFTSHRDGNYGIHLMNADGSGTISLTDDPTHAEDPSWSPDGQRIAFVSERDGNPEIYVMNADGSDHRRLTENRRVTKSPTGRMTDGGLHSSHSGT